MRIKNLEDISKLGPSARKQIEATLKEQGGFNNQKRPSDTQGFRTKKKEAHSPKVEPKTKKTKPSRVMRTAEGATYCPWPSTDPFVAIHQRLEAKYGLYENGGMLVTEMIIDGGTKNWRFDFALISPFEKVSLRSVDGRPSSFLLGYSCLVEADGFGFHRSKDAFKNDRAKQTHALKQGFAVKRVTNEDARQRLDEVINDIDKIMSQPRLYDKEYEITPKGMTQFVLRWV